MKEKKETEAPRRTTPDWKVIGGTLLAIVVLILILTGKVTPSKMTVFGVELIFNPTNTPIAEISATQTATPVSSSNRLPTSDPCYGFNSRVYKGEKVYTANALNKSLNIRKLPSLSAPTVTSLQNNAELQILNGPICADGIMWWEAATTDGGVKGWVAEVSSSGVYYLKP